MRTKKQQGSAAIITIVVLVVIAGAIFFFSRQSAAPESPVQSNDAMMEEDSMIEQGKDMMGDESNLMQENEDAMTEEDSMMQEDEDGMMEDGKDDVMMKDSANMQTSAGVYTEYSSSSFQAASDKTRILFFHAKWCPTCIAANADISSRADEIPDNVVIFKTDYDTEDELKSKYGITYQHTFVLVDSEGNELKKWNGGDLDTIISSI